MAPSKKNVRSRPQKKNSNPRRRSGPVRRSTQSSGTTISAAPAALGSISRGVKPAVLTGPDGCRVVGEDLAGVASALSANNTTWATCAGFALSPYSLGYNTMADMSRIYSEWRFEKVAMAYVPAIGTSAAGQAALYHKKDRGDPHIDPNGSQFLNYVLSQSTGVVGPVWQPMAINVPCSRDWRSTTPLRNGDVNDDADGEVFLTTNHFSSPALSIGLVKIQYVISFRGMARNPRLSIVPCPQQVYENISFGRNGVSVNTSTSIGGQVFGNDQTGNPNAFTEIGGGAIYKFILDLNRSSLGAATQDNLVAEFVAGGSWQVKLENGFTCFLWTDKNNTYYLCPTFAAAQSGRTYVYGLANGSLVYNLVGMVSLVGSTNSLLQADIVNIT